MAGDFPTKLPDLWPVGPGGLVATNRIVAVGRWDSTPMRRAVRSAKTSGMLLDLTYGHACKWVLFLDSGHLVLATEPIPLSIVEVLSPNPVFLKRHLEEPDETDASDGTTGSA